jgi:hypothetical protein
MLPTHKIVPFIKLPNKLVWARHKNNNEKTLIQDALEIIGDASTASMLPEILAQLNWRVTRLSTCNFTIAGLVKSCGYVPKTGNNKSINKFREILMLLQEWKYLINVQLEEGETMETISASSEITCEIDNRFLKKGEEDIEFFTVDLSVYNTLSKLNISSASKRNAINIYFYISARILSASPVSENHSKDSIRNYCYFGQTEIATSLQISKSTVVSCLKVLGDSKLVYYGNIGSISGKNSKGEQGAVYATNIYAKTPEGLKQGLSYSKSFHEKRKGGKD